MLGKRGQAKLKSELAITIDTTKADSRRVKAHKRVKHLIAQK